MKNAPFLCRYCGKCHRTAYALAHHVANKASCATADQERKQAQLNAAPTNHTPLGSDPQDSSTSRLPSPHFENLSHPPLSSHRPTVEDYPEEDDEVHQNVQNEPYLDVDNEQYAQGTQYQRAYPRTGAGAVIEDTPTGTSFEKLRAEQRKKGQALYHPFESFAEWKLARWMVKNLGQGQMNEMLELEVVSPTVLLRVIRSLPLDSYMSGRMQKSPFGTHARCSRP